MTLFMASLVWFFAGMWLGVRIERRWLIEHPREYYEAQRK